MINPPTSGTSQSQYIGTKINSLYADVRLQIAIDYTKPTIHESLRIIVARSRVSGQDNVNYPPTPVNINEPIDAKSWDIMYDRIWSMNTGIPINATVAGTQYAIFSEAAPVKHLRFKIPLKETIQQKNSRLIYEYPIVIWAISLNGGISLYRATCKFFYRDP